LAAPWRDWCVFDQFRFHAQRLEDAAGNVERAVGIGVDDPCDERLLHVGHFGQLLLGQFAAVHVAQTCRTTFGIASVDNDYNTAMKTITCKLSEALDAELAAVAREEGLSKSQILRKALEDRIGRRRRARRSPRAFDLVGDLSGSVKGPADLLTNPKYMESFGA